MTDTGVQLLSEQIRESHVRVRAGDDGSVVKSSGCSCRGPMVLTIHMAAHNHLQLQSEGI